MKKIKFNTIGKIIKGDQEGWFVLVEHDTKDTGGYYVYQAPIPEIKESTVGYDDWLESLEDVQGYFEESDWDIEWLST